MSSLIEVVASGGTDEKRAEAALAEALALSLNQSKGRALSAEQRELAEKLRGGERTTTLNEWLARNVRAGLRRASGARRS